MMSAAAAEQPIETPKKLSPRRCHVAHAWLNTPIYAELESEAMRRRVHPDQLVAQLIETTIINGLVDAVLDR